MTKRGMTRILCLMLCIMAGCSSAEASKGSVGQPNADGYIVTELTTAIGGNPPVTETDQNGSVNSNVSQTENGGEKTSSWFDDAVFVGDSVTLKLNYYCDEHPEALGNAKFFCAGSMGYTNTQEGESTEELIQPYYKGSERNTEECAVITESSKVFVMLGMNDIGLYGTDDSLSSAEKLLAKIHKNSPKATIYVQSVTPMLPSFERETWNNTLIREFNDKLQNLATQKGYHYLDIYSIMADENGCLKEEYCGDPEAMGIHFTSEACEVWCDYLKHYV